MKIRMTTDLFDSKTYNLEVKDENILISENDRQIAFIPISQIKYFGLDGKGERLKHFVLETEEKIYEGIFPETEDAEEFVNSIRKISHCSIDISLEAFGGNQNERKA